MNELDGIGQIPFKVCTIVVDIKKEI